MFHITALSQDKRIIEVWWLWERDEKGGKEEEGRGLGMKKERRGGREEFESRAGG